MADNTANTQQLTPEEFKEIEGFLKEKQVDVQVKVSPQNVRRIDDGSLIIDAPKFQIGFIKVAPTKTNGKSQLETA